MNTKPKTKVLTISLLCCGRPDTTEQCLKSLMPIREAVDSEIIVVDTGCDAETRAIVDKYADEVIEFEWCNDFAKARNVQLDAANGEWFMFLDDDEYFIECQDIIDFFDSSEYKKYSFGGYKKRDYKNFKATDWEDHRAMRMVKMTDEITFVGKIHEDIKGYVGPGILFKATVGHFGYCYETEQDAIAHSKRNVSLLLEMIEEEPDNMRWYTHLAQEYYPCEGNKADKLFELCNRALCRHDFKESELSEYNTLRLGKLYALEALNRESQLIKEYESICNDNNMFDLAIASASVIMAGFYFLKCDFQNCLDKCVQYMEVYEALVDEPFSLYKQTTIFADDTLRMRVLMLVLSEMFASAIKQKRFDIIQKYCEYGDWNSDNLVISRAFFQIMLEALLVNEYSLSLQRLVSKIQDNEGLMAAFKFEIHENGMTIPNEILEGLKRYFFERESIVDYISAQQIRKNNPEQYDEVYVLEGQMRDEISNLTAGGMVEQANAAEEQLHEILYRMYGINTLR